MDKLDRIYALHKLLSKRRTPISRIDLEHRLGLKRATTTRLISFCRDTLHMPIEFDKDRGGYHYAIVEQESYELPGLWFNPSELIALMTSFDICPQTESRRLQSQDNDTAVTHTLRANLMPIA